MGNQQPNFTVECEITVVKKVRKKKANEKVEIGRLPRISKLMALAIHFQQLVNDGKVNDYADIARLGYVSRARLTQIMDLTLLASDIQEEILFLPEVKTGRDPVTERQVRKVGALQNWSAQRVLWEKLCHDIK